jgi:hypothetical protein
MNKKSILPFHNPPPPHSEIKKSQEKQKPSLVPLAAKERKIDSKKGLDFELLERTRKELQCKKNLEENTEYGKAIIDSLDMKKFEAEKSFHLCLNLSSNGQPKPEDSDLFFYCKKNRKERTEKKENECDVWMIRALYNIFVKTTDGTSKEEEEDDDDIFANVGRDYNVADNDKKMENFINQLKKKEEKDLGYIDDFNATAEYAFEEVITSQEDNETRNSFFERK